MKNYWLGNWGSILSLVVVITLCISGPNFAADLNQNDFKIAGSKPVVVQIKSASVKIAQNTNNHLHQCGVCGTTWVHTDASHGIKKDHMCPNPECGAGPWWEPKTTTKVVVPPRQIQQAAPQYFYPQYNQRSCPTGGCPTSG